MKFKKSKNSTSDTGAKVVVGSGSKKLSLPKFSKKQKLIGTGILLLVLALAFAFWPKANSPGPEAAPPSFAVGDPCSTNTEDSLLRRTVNVLDPSHPERLPKLEDLVSEIKQTPNFERDPNCLYPIVFFHTTRTDIAEAREYHAQLEKLLDEGSELHALYNTDRKTIKKQVEFLKNYEEQANDSTLFSNPPEERQ